MNVSTSFWDLAAHIGTENMCERVSDNVCGQKGPWSQGKSSFPALLLLPP